jgi:hypothetical protein
MSWQDGRLPSSLPNCSIREPQAGPMATSRDIEEACRRRSLVRHHAHEHALPIPIQSTALRPWPGPQEPKEQLVIGHIEWTSTQRRQVLSPRNA